MKEILLKDIPQRCPECDAVMFGSPPRPRMSKRALWTGLAGIPVTLVWVFLFFQFSPYYIVPSGLGGVALAALVYGWPLAIAALLARRYPNEVKASCFKCNWTELYRIQTPKL